MPPEIEADFIIQPPEGFDCSFEIYASGTVWGAIEGDIENQSDLKNALDSKADDTEITEIDGRLDTIESTLSGYGNIVTHDTNEFATAEQGQKADNAVPNTRTVNGKALSSNITLNYSDVGALSSSTTINDLTTTAQQNALNSGATTTNIGQIATNTNAISLINGKIPTQASTTNQLADKNFVNSSIATNTANFIGTFNSVADLEAYSGTLTNNDYAFVISTDADGNTVYNRYKWNGSEWLFEYALNNSSFTASQWASINSGVTSTDVTLLGTINTTMSGYGNIVTHNVSEFATASQGALANTSLQNGTDVINALGYTPYNSTNPNNYSSTLNGLTDVSLTNPTQGQNLTYDAVNQKWINSSTTATVGWGGITGTLSDQSDLQNALNDKQNVIDGNNKLSASYISGLGAVATSNNYNDLSNKPTIPSAQVNSDWNANSGVAQILNKPTLSTVATSGSYNDLTNKPTIPTVNNATLTIQKNGTNVQTFTANASTNATANIIVPTDVSDLTNTTLANVSLSNLDTTGNNRLHALKGYTENGQVYSDSTLYNDVYAQYHSTFDASKFTVVGTPTITSDGIASGFSNGNTNGLRTPSITFGRNVDLIIKFNTGDLLNDGDIISAKSSSERSINLAIKSNGKLRYSLSSDSSTYDIINYQEGDNTLNANSDYFVKLNFNGSQYTFSISTDGITYTTDYITLSSDIIATNILTLGSTTTSGNTTYNFHGSIDLKQFSITVDGVQVFSGNKTGTDTYYTNDYTIVGSPTITNGIASGFSKTKYITKTLDVASDLSKEYVVICKFNYSAVDPYSQHVILNIVNNTNKTAHLVRVSANYSNGNMTFSDCLYANSETGNTGGTSFGGTINVGDNYIKLVMKNRNLKVYHGISLDNLTLISEKTNFYMSGMSTIGFNHDTLENGKDSASCSQDLNVFEVYEDDRLIYAPILKVNYSITQNYCKIAPVDYRGKAVLVGDLYGYSPYFTIDTVNQNTTLPMPDLYSIIYRNTIANSFTSIQGYDGTATQTLKHVSGVLQWVSDT